MLAMRAGWRITARIVIDDVDAGSVLNQARDAVEVAVTGGVHQGRATLVVPEVWVGSAAAQQRVQDGQVALTCGDHQCRGAVYGVQHVDELRYTTTEDRLQSSDVAPSH